jgi:hypothetical protein
MVIYPIKKTRGSSEGSDPKYVDNRTAGTSEDMAMNFKMRIGQSEFFLSY